MLSYVLDPVWLQFGGVDLEPGTSTLWFAGKELQQGKKLSEYLGRNENTRAIVKLQKKGAGPPAREAVSVLARTQWGRLHFAVLQQWGLSWGSCLLCKD